MSHVSRSDRSGDNGEPPSSDKAASAFPQTFALAPLLVDLRRHAEFDLTTLTYHIEQSDATAGDGYWHASINEARSALEALLVDIVRVVGADEPTRPPTSNGTPFSNWRRYLVDAGFLDGHESDLLHFVYGLSSTKGSHHGVSDEDWSRLARRMVFCTADYVLRRYATWKEREARPASPSSSATSPPRLNRSGTSGLVFPSLRAWLSLCGRLR